MNERARGATFGMVMAASLLAGCAGGAAGTGAVASATTAAGEPQTVVVTATPAPMPAVDVEGTILIDGSSTVAPITAAVAESFRDVYPNVRVPVGISGTGGGFKAFCAGETDISDASRPIKESEVDLCKENNVEYVELPVAYDGLAVLVNPQNDFVSCLTVAEMKTMWSPEAEDVVLNWNQIRAGFPAQPFTLYGPGVDSGTYDYFTQAVVGVEGASRGDFQPSEDDNVLVQGIAGDANALGFFGLAYYEANKDKLKLVSVDGGSGCVAPTTQTVANGTYQPLSRPLFIYVNKARIDEKDEISAFVEFYLKSASQLVGEVGYISLGAELYGLAQKRYGDRVTGSVFEGLGSTVGVKLADLLAKEE